VLKKNH